MQTFDPCKHHRANSPRFFNYINLCLANKFRSMHSTQMKNPPCHPGQSVLTTLWEDADRDQVDDEVCHRHSEHPKRRCQPQGIHWLSSRSS